ncbi:MAG TPA: ester cyclase [Dehalococcoidia bacterium]|nr:ester cyclase [Dehalococcoidia bacterium]
MANIEENKKTIKRYFEELMNKQDYSKADEILHEDYTGAALGGLKGVDAHKQVVKQLHSYSSNLTYETLEMIAEGDKIAIFQKVSGTHDGEFNGIQPTGIEFSMNGSSVYELKDGKMYRGLSNAVGDWLGMYQQLGVLPPTADFIQAYNDSLK